MSTFNSPLSEQPRTPKAIELEKRLLQSCYFGNRQRMEYQVNFYRNQYSHWSEEDVLDKIWWDWMRDRR